MARFRCLSGRHDDNWLAQRAVFEISNSDIVELRFYLPNSGENEGKGFIVSASDRILMSGFIPRGRLSEFEIHVSKDNGGNQIGIEFDAPDDMPGDARSLGAVCLAYRLGEGEWRSAAETVERDTDLATNSAKIAETPRSNYEPLSPAFNEDPDLNAVAPYFDEAYYLKQRPKLRDGPLSPLAHYMTTGWKERLNPSKSFDTDFYLRSNPDIAAARLNPFLHYVLHGRREMRPAAPYFALRLADYSPLVSVIVPNFNHAAFLEQRLQSIFDQTYRNIELIILDDFSQDNSREILDELAARSPFPVKKLYNELNSGNVFAQWQRGFALAEGALVWICESDDTCQPEALEYLTAHFADRSVMIAFAQIQFCNAQGEILPGLDHYRENAEPGIWSQPITRHASEWFGGAFGRNNVIANVGGCVLRNQKIAPSVWEEARSFNICGDWYLYIELASGGQIVYDPRAVTFFRQHAANTSAANFDKLYYYEEHKKILRILTYNWKIPPSTQEGFLSSLRSQWIHYGLERKYGELDVAIDLTDAVTAEKREHFIIGSLGFTYGGGEIFPIHLANKLCELGYRVSMICINLNNIEKELLLRLKSSIAVFDAATVRMEGPRAFLSRIGATLVHSHVVNIDDLFYKTGGGIEDFPYVVSLHGSHQGENLNIDALLFRMLRRVRKWVYTSDRNLEIFEGAPLNLGALKKIPNAMPLDQRPFPLTRADLNIDADTVVFTFVARGIQQKGWRAAVKALKLLLAARPDAKVHLLMVGAGPKADEAVKLANEGLPVTFLGLQSCINGLYRISDCALAPTRFIGESFPLCVIQALQEGLPVIATRVGEIPAMISIGAETAGVLMDNVRESPQFFETVCAAMLEMMDPDRRAHASQIARQLREQFDMDLMAQRYLAVYDSAVRDVGSHVAAAHRPAANPRQGVLVIGAAGFIGSHVAARLAQSGARVVGLATRQRADIAFERFHIGRSELVGELKAAIEGCDTVVFAGGTSRPGSPMRSLGVEIATEACHLMDIAELCGARGVKRFIFISSGGAVYGPTNAPFIAETHVTRPINSYGLAKLAAEHGMRLAAARTGMQALALRVANPYGPGQVVKGSQGFVAAAIRAIKNNADLEIWGDGSVTRDFIYIDDVAAAFVSAISNDISADTLNIGSGTGASLREIVEVLRELSGAPLEINYKPARSVDAPKVVLDISQAERLLGWKPQFDLRQGLSATLAREDLLI